MNPTNIVIIVSAFAFWLIVLGYALTWLLNRRAWALDLYRLSHWFYGAAVRMEER